MRVGAFATLGVSPRRCPSVVKVNVVFPGLIGHVAIVRVIYSVLKHHMFLYNYT